MIIECDGKNIDFTKDYIRYIGLFKKNIEVKYSDIIHVEFKICINRFKNYDATKKVGVMIKTEKKKHYFSIPYSSNGEVESFLRKKNIVIKKKFVENINCESYGD